MRGLDEIRLALLENEKRKRIIGHSDGGLVHPWRHRVESGKDFLGNTGSRFFALLAPRRWGKTENWVHEVAIKGMLKNRYARYGYIADTCSSAMDIAWPIVEELNDRYNYGFKPAERFMKWVNPATKSYLRLYGADHPKFVKRLRGPKFWGVCIDEAQNFASSNLGYLINSVLIPGTSDHQGWIFLQGTPGNEDYGYFYEVIRGLHKEYIFIQGKPFENPWTAKQLRHDLDVLKLSNPDIESEPWVQREFFGIWAPDNRKNVIKLSPKLNYLYKWEPSPGDIYTLGIDFGFDDPSAYVLGVENHKLYPYFAYLDVEIKAGMYLHDHINMIQGFRAKYPGLRIFADPGGASKQLVEEMRIKHGIPIQSANKQEKRMHVERINSECTMAMIKIYNMKDPQRPEDSLLVQQWNKLIKVYKRGVQVDDKTDILSMGDELGEWEEGEPRHIHDAAVYCRRGATRAHFRPEEKKSRTQIEEEKMFKYAMNHSRHGRR